MTWLIGIDTLAWSGTALTFDCPGPESYISNSYNGHLVTKNSEVQQSNCVILFMDLPVKTPKQCDYYSQIV
ncbi:hypothetical protein EGC82_16320 [Shewanella livingstonensis]|uniref:Uncharacterized protein n=1 Tax=Shewanella livingstonensis TaxID=150120 RepID=A0A3G8LZP6_9GAMM|nr:hypothetical protein [Shewanella livingstonensis]AZG74178.1 hypothetical protein EGC82_16320 [Shewanella livingstonensis]